MRSHPYFGIIVMAYNPRTSVSTNRTERPQRGRAIFYSRDSGGRHEMTLPEYVNWAAAKAVELGLSFDGTAEAIQLMVRQKKSKMGDLFLDYGVQGHLLERPALDQLREEALSDKQVSHILIP